MLPFIAIAAKTENYAVDKVFIQLPDFLRFNYKS